MSSARDVLGFHSDVREALGLGRKAKLPTEGMDGQYLRSERLGLIDVWVLPLRRTEGRKSSKHRVVCACPRCRTQVSVGRLHQHLGTARCKMQSLRSNDSLNRS